MRCFFMVMCDGAQVKRRKYVPQPKRFSAAVTYKCVMLSIPRSRPRAALGSSHAGDVVLSPSLRRSSDFTFRCGASTISRICSKGILDGLRRHTITIACYLRNPRCVTAELEGSCTFPTLPFNFFRCTTGYLFRRIVRRRRGGDYPLWSNHHWRYCNDA